MKIGFIGLGIMGKPMAKNLLKAGYTDLLVNNLGQAAVLELEAAGAKGATYQEIGEQCDVMIIEGNDKPGFKIDLHIKDLNNALDCAHSIGAPVPMTAEVQEILQWLHNRGKGQADHSAIAQYYEMLTGIQIGR